MKITSDKIKLNSIINKLNFNKAVKYVDIKCVRAKTLLSKAFKGKDLIHQKPHIDKCEKEFWGIESGNKLFERLTNHMILSTLKRKELNCKTISGISEFSELRQIFQKGEGKKFLDKNGVLRVTFKGGHFPFTFEGVECNHTIGFVLDKKHKTLYVLDSLGNIEPALKNFHNAILKALKNDFGNFDYDNVIFNNAKQQSDYYLTCSNWTWANIEAVKRITDKGGYIPNAKILDEILPKNINDVLKEQHAYIYGNMDKLAQRHRNML